jgi:uncharacterized protein (DUF305 family)
MPKLTPQQTDQITNLLTAWYQTKYGNKWKENMYKNMRPSPKRDWAQMLNVTEKDIQYVHTMLVMNYAFEEFDAHYETN